MYVIFGFDGSRLYLIHSYDDAFLKDSKSVRNAKMVIGTKIALLYDHKRADASNERFLMLLCYVIGRSFSSKTPST